MQRDTTTGKTRFDLAFDGPMFERWAELLTRGAVKYKARNWMKAAGTAELERFKESAVRHFIQWLRGDTDEDHGAAVFFNINGAEYVKGLTPAQCCDHGVPLVKDCQQCADLFTTFRDEAIHGKEENE
jgi:hypothetical protein